MKKLIMATYDLRQPYHEKFKSVFFRLKRVCNTTEDFKEKAEDMKVRFVQRGYPVDWIDGADESMH